jgi:DNA-binding MarR family transcriptional regulator
VDGEMDDVNERARLRATVLDLNVELTRQIHRGVPREWIEMEVTMPQLKTLMVLYGMGQATMGDLAEALGTGVSTVTGIVDRLVEHGLVVREEDPRDRRVVVGRPTSKGIAIIDRLVVLARDRMDSVLGQLDLDDLRVVARSAAILCDAARQAFSPIASCTYSRDQVKLGGT